MAKKVLIVKQDDPPPPKKKKKKKKKIIIIIENHEHVNHYISCSFTSLFTFIAENSELVFRFIKCISIKGEAFPSIYGG